MHTTTDTARGTATFACEHPLLAALNREWAERYERAASPSPPDWAHTPPLDRYGHPADAFAALSAPATAGAEREALLGALTDRAAAGDPQASRVVLQYLLPNLLQVLKCAWGSSSRTRDETIADLVGAAWLTLAEGVDRREDRPVKLALLRRIEHVALGYPRKLDRRRAEHEVHADPPLRGATADLAGRPAHRSPSAEEEVLDLLADAARAGLDAADVRCLALLSIGRLTPETAAAVEGVTGRMMRYRRAGAIRRLTELAA